MGDWRGKFAVEEQQGGAQGDIALEVPRENRTPQGLAPGGALVAEKR